jgi:hypothetical protein
VKNSVGEKWKGLVFGLYMRRILYFQLLPPKMLLGDSADCRIMQTGTMADLFYITIRAPDKMYDKKYFKIS